MQNLLRRFLVVELFVGVLAVILGIVLTVLVWDTGYYPGAMMLIVTGALTLTLSSRELMHPTPKEEKNKFMNLLYTIMRRAFFFLNLMLSTLVFGTLTNLLY